MILVELLRRLLNILLARFIFIRCDPLIVNVGFIVGERGIFAILLVEREQPVSQLASLVLDGTDLCRGIRIRQQQVEKKIPSIRTPFSIFSIEEPWFLLTLR